MPRRIDDKALLRLLKSEVAQAGSARKWAIANGLTPVYVSMVLRGKREPAEAICKALGYKRVRQIKTMYEPI